MSGAGRHPRGGPGRTPPGAARGLRLVPARAPGDGADAAPGEHPPVRVGHPRRGRGAAGRRRAAAGGGGPGALGGGGGHPARVRVAPRRGHRPASLARRLGLGAGHRSGAGAPRDRRRGRGGAGAAAPRRGAVAARTLRLPGPRSPHLAGRGGAPQGGPTHAGSAGRARPRRRRRRRRRGRGRRRRRRRQTPARAARRGRERRRGERRRRGRGSLGRRGRRSARTAARTTPPPRCLPIWTR